ncbi:MAG: Nif3-like dinuclear metal center hexameric protein [Bacillota bacterium]
MVTVGAIMEELEAWAPRSLASDWDNVGLQVGSTAAQASKVLVCLDVTQATVEEAIGRHCDLIVSHHPLIFGSLKQLSADSPIGRIIHKLVKHDVSLCCLHTNLDVAPGGVEDTLADLLELQDVRVLAPVGTEKLYKIVVFVPKGYEDKVRDAMAQKGAGWIGNYSHCSFQVEGTGTFKPLEGSNPFIGQQGQLEKVAEFRLETIVPQRILRDVVTAMLEVHPYEEVAYDIYPLQNEGKAYGFGRVGRLPKPLTVSELVQHVNKALGCDQVRVVTSGPGQQVDKVATSCGSGGDKVELCSRAGAKVLVTGDVKYHDALKALAQGLTVIDAGHYFTERPVLGKIVDRLRLKFGDRIEVVMSQVERNAFYAAPGKEVRIYADGASAGNPGWAGVGLVIEREDGSRVEKSIHVGQATNNVAEYLALIEALKAAKELGATRVTVFSDSELVVNQIKGQYAVHSPELRSLLAEVSKLKADFEHVDIVHVPREQNQLADSLSKAAARHP